MPARKLLPVTAAGPRDIAGQPLTRVPPPPPWMNDVASSKFIELMAYFVDVGAITAGEVPLVEQFSCCYARWWQSEIELANGDPGWRTVVTRQGTDGSSVPTPAMLTNRTALEQLRKLATVLGLSPVDRAKLPASRVGGEEDPMDVLLAKRSA